MHLWTNNDTDNQRFRLRREATPGPNASWVNGTYKGADTLYSGQTLSACEYLMSQNRKYIAILQNDGNFVVYSHLGWHWNAGTNTAKSTWLVLQGDGNVVIYGNNDSKAHWATYTSNAHRLVMQDDGNLVAYAKDGKAVWASHTRNPGGEPYPAPDTDWTPKKTMTYNGHTYSLFEPKVNWHEARALCEKFGGYLVTITSQEEQTAIEKLREDYQAQIHIGAYKDGSTWKWVSGEPFSYTNWGAGEPSGGKEHLVEMGINPKWNDIEYKHLRAFVVETDYAPPEITEVAVSGNSSVRVQLTHSLQNDDVLIVATYQGGKLLTTATKSITGTETLVDIAIPANADTIKAFVWNGLNTMRPLCKEKTLKRSGSAWHSE